MTPLQALAAILKEEGLHILDYEQQPYFHIINPNGQPPWVIFQPTNTTRIKMNNRTKTSHDLDLADPNIITQITNNLKPTKESWTIIKPNQQ